MKDRYFYVRWLVDCLKKSTDPEHGPFAAMVVGLDGLIMSLGRNSVVAYCDPTAHAEIVAIRRAAEHLGTHNLAYCTLYTTCEPCPMCAAAIYWAGISEVVYIATEQDADGMGFADKVIRHQVKLVPSERGRPFIHDSSLYAEVADYMKNWKGNRY